MSPRGGQGASGRAESTTPGVCCPTSSPAFHRVISPGCGDHAPEISTVGSTPSRPGGERRSGAPIDRPSRRPGGLDSSAPLSDCAEVLIVRRVRNRRKRDCPESPARLIRRVASGVSIAASGRTSSAGDAPSVGRSRAHLHDHGTLLVAGVTRPSIATHPVTRGRRETPAMWTEHAPRLGLARRGFVRGRAGRGLDPKRPCRRAHLWPIRCRSRAPRRCPARADRQRRRSSRAARRFRLPSAPSRCLAAKVVLPER